MDTRGRMDAIDVARGLAIIAIALGHVLRGLAASGILADGPAFWRADNVLYSFHLAVFAFLSGLFVRRSIEARGRWRYASDRTLTFLYLYVLWSLIQGSVKLLTASLVNSRTSVKDVLDLTRPDAQFWFLPFLAAMTCLAVLAMPWRNRLSTCATLLASAGLSLSVWGLDGGLIGTQGWSLTAFFAVGCVWGAESFSRVLESISVPVLAASAAVGVAALWFASGSGLPPTIQSDERPLLDLAQGVVASVSGVSSLVVFSELVRRLPAASTAWLRFIGQRSLEIFLAHIIAASGARIILDAAGVSAPTPHILLGTAAAVGLPVLLWVVVRDTPLKLLFMRPRLP